MTANEVQARRALTAGMTNAEHKAYWKAQHELEFAAARAKSDADWARTIAKPSGYEAPANHPAIVNAMVS